jgi:putative salt-induced outer membrane protein YdiY
LNGKGKYLNAIAQDVQTGESFEISLRGGRKFTEFDDAFVEHTYLKNRFSGVDNRNTSSVGYGHFWFKSDEQTLRNEVGVGYTSEDRTDGTKLSFMSGLVGLLYKYKLSPTADFTHETKYLPNFKNGEDWRLTTETSISAAISSMFSSKVSWKYEHVNLPPVGKVRGDTTTTVSLLAKF